MSTGAGDDVAYIDLGHDVRYAFASWAPDRELNPDVAHLPDVDRYQILLEHDCNGERIANGLVLDSEVSRELDPDPRPRWEVKSWEPLTLHPSILCLTCKLHGWIRDGAWVPA